MNWFQRLSVWVVAVSLGVPGAALAFNLDTAGISEIARGGSVTITLQGMAQAIQSLEVDANPSFDVFSVPAETDIDFFVGSIGGASSLVLELKSVDASLAPPIVFGLSNLDDESDPFDIDGSIVSLRLNVRDDAPLGVTSFVFNVCSTDFTCQVGVKGATPRIELPIRFLIIRTDGEPGRVPEPATLWLAMAALVAGGVVFRSRDSKRS